MSKMQLGPNMPQMDDMQIDSLQQNLNHMLSAVQQGLANSPLFSGRLEDVKKSLRKESERKPRWNINEDDQMVSDPLWFSMEELDSDAFQDYLEARESGEIEPQHPFVIAVAPDIHHKANFSGGGGYEIALPNPAADIPLLNEDHHTTFINYLRIAFRWGGFPGLDDKEVIALLTKDLLPI